MLGAATRKKRKPFQIVIRGALPGRQLKLILAWCELHKDELMQNWELARTAAPLNHIAPLI